MTVDKIPFDDQEASGLDQLAGAPSLMSNNMTDIANVRKPRPGIGTWAPFPATPPVASPVVAMTSLGDFLVFVTEDRQVWSITASGVVAALSDATLASKVAGSLKPIAQKLRTQVLIVGGGLPQATDGLTVSAPIEAPPLSSDPNPPEAKAIAAIATRVVLAPNNDSGTVQWSAPNSTTSWDPLNFAEAEAKPDIVVTIASNTNELFVFGSETTQVFSPDPVVAFAPGRTLNVGILAGYSLVEVDDHFGFLDRERRFVLTDGRSFSDDESVLSKPIESVLRGMATVADCWGFRMRTDRWDACVWFFPTEGRGFIWNRRNNGWSDWRSSVTITSAYYWPEQNVFLVGLATGQIAQLTADATTDLGQPIKIELITGFVDRDTDNLKKCDAVKLVFKRGDTAQSSTAPHVQVSWRDDLGAFCTPSTLDLGNAGDYNPTLELRSLGQYRRRQWRIVYTADAGFTFVGAREQFQVLDN